MEDGRNILLIDHYAGAPSMGMEFRPYYFAREWVRLGYTASVLAADYSHLRRVNPTVSHDLDMTDIDGISYYWIHTVRYNGNGIKRALSIFEFVIKIFIKSRKIVCELKPDVVICSSTYPLDTYAGQLIRRISKKKCILIHEVHDMWPITPVEINGMSLHNPFIWVLQRAEDSFCKQSDRVVSLLPCAKDYLIIHGMDEPKFVHIPNGIVEEEWENPEPIPIQIHSLINEIRSKHRKILCFTGSHTRSYALDYLIDAVKRIDPTEICLLMVGDGIYKQELVRRAAEADNIRFLDSVPKGIIPSLLEQVDFLFVGALRNRMFRFGICMNKLFDAMMSGKPILYSVEAPNNYVEEYGCGISVEAESTDAIEDGLRRLLSMDDEELVNMGSNGKKAALQVFNIKNLAARFAQLFG